MSKKPVNMSEFDYLLWKDEAGRGHVKVKRTGEETEVDDDVFSLLRREERRVRRYLQPLCEHEEIVPWMNVEMMISEEDELSGFDPTDEYICAIIEKDFINTLQPGERRLYDMKFTEDKPLEKCAKALGTSERTVERQLAEIRKNAMKYFGGRTA